MLLLVFLVWRPACDVAAQTDQISRLPREPVTVYFNQCYGALVEENEPAARDSALNPEKMLYFLLNSATQSIDVCIFDIDMASEVFIEAHRRGVAVRVVTETSNLKSKQDPTKPRKAITDMIEAGIPVKDDGHNGYMHHKFIIVDGTWVWFGSINLTATSLYHHNNNAVLVRSRRLAAVFGKEFDELFVQERFVGPRHQALHPVVRIGDAELEVHFSPNGGARQAMLDELERATNSICFMAFSFTDTIAARIMVEKKKARLNVEGIYDDCMISSSSTYSFMTNAGMRVYRDGNQALMHHKAIIVDNDAVIAGSYNYSVSAEISNNEALVIMRSPRIAAIYGEEFDRLKHAALNHTDIPPYDHPACRRPMPRL
jgi:phosphatidylserine/phosphatidylglycerophosphate/cardiolipin synthase-like enzyme